MLNNINEFKKDTFENISNMPSETDKERLYSILRSIRDVNKVNKLIMCYKNNMKESIQTLKKFD